MILCNLLHPGYGRTGIGSQIHQARVLRRPAGDVHDEGYDRAIGAADSKKILSSPNMRS